MAPMVQKPASLQPCERAIEVGRRSAQEKARERQFLISAGVLAKIGNSFEFRV